MNDFYITIWYIYSHTAIEYMYTHIYVFAKESSFMYIVERKDELYATDRRQCYGMLACILLSFDVPWCSVVDDICMTL